MPLSLIAAAEAQPSVISQLLLFVPFFAIFYFMFVRPQSKRAKEHKAMINALTVGNEVVFAGGLMGKVKKIEGEYAVIALTHNMEIKIQRASVISVLPNGTIDNI